MSCPAPRTPSDRDAQGVGPERASGWASHVANLGLCLTVLLAAAVLRIDAADRVVLPGWNVPLPEVCSLRRATGAKCPGCGLTRSWIRLAHGQLAAAWRYHPAGPLLFGVALVLVPCELAQLARLRRGQPPWPVNRYLLWPLSSAVVVWYFCWLWASRFC